MTSIQELKTEIKNEVMADVKKAISELRDSLNKQRNKDVGEINKNFKDIFKRLDELSGRRER